MSVTFDRFKRLHGVTVSTLDFESSDPSSNLGGALVFVLDDSNGSNLDNINFSHFYIILQL